MKLLKNKIIKNILTIMIVGIVGYFFYESINRNWEAVKEIQFNFNILSVVAISLLILAVVHSGYLWGKILDLQTNNFGKKLNPIEAVRVHIESWLLKYIPGQAGSMVNKIAWAKGMGYSKKMVLVSFIYENIFLLVASFILGLPVFFSVISSSVNNKLIYLLALGLFILISTLVLNQRSMESISNFVFSKTIKQSAGKEIFLGNWQSLWMQLHYLVPRIFNGIGFVFVTVSLVNVDPVAYIPLGSAYILAGAIGLLAVFVPSGIGVREAVIAIAVAPYLEPGQAVIVALLARFYSTMADGTLAVGYWLLNLYKDRIRV